MDVIWAHLSAKKSHITGAPRFQRLAKVAQLVLCLPHSNANSERTFSVIGLNKTETRNKLSLEGTLSSVMYIKMTEMEPCYKYEPPVQVIKNSKSVASAYKKGHSTK